MRTIITILVLVLVLVLSGCSLPSSPRSFNLPEEETVTESESESEEAWVSASDSASESGYIEESDTPVDTGSVLDTGTGEDTEPVDDTWWITEETVETVNTVDTTFDTGTGTGTGYEEETVETVSEEETYEDTGSWEETVIDTGSEEETIIDTGSVDTGPVDTGSVDTGPVDTGPAPVCEAQVESFDTNVRPEGWNPDWYWHDTPATGMDGGYLWYYTHVTSISSQTLNGIKTYPIDLETCADAQISITYTYFFNVTCTDWLMEVQISLNHVSILLDGLYPSYGEHSGTITKNVRDYLNPTFPDSIKVWTRLHAPRPKLTNCHAEGYLLIDNIIIE